MPSAICPYLGLLDDPDTCLAFPTDRNACQRTVPVEPISLEHQSAYCLTYKYTECPIYIGETLPAENADRARARRSKLLRRGCILIWLVVVVLGIAALIPFLNDYQQTRTSQTPTVNSELVGLPLPAAETATPTAIPASPTTTPEIPTLEPSPTGCTLPAGWVPYVLTAEDNVIYLAQAVGLTVEALQQGNCGADLSSVESGHVIFLPYIPTSTPDLSQLLTPTNTVVSIIIIDTSTPTPSLTPIPVTPTRYVPPPTATKTPKPNPPPSRPSPTPPDSRP